MKKKKIDLIVGCILLALIGIGIFICYLSVKDYQSKIPTVTVKNGVEISEGDTIELQDVADISDNMVEYKITAKWLDGTTDGLEFDEKYHTVRVAKGKGKLEVSVGACGSNYEYVGDETIVIVN